MSGLFGYSVFVRGRHDLPRKSVAGALTAAVAFASFGYVGLSTIRTSAHAAGGGTGSWTVPTVPAQQRTLVLGCAAGQVDLNHASLAQLQALPGVSAPIAQRIVVARPHDRTRDLLVVPGIGPDTLSAIDASKKACSTPLTVPPPSKDVCTSSQQLDVNDPASRPGLVNLFGAPTADRVIAAEPFPDLPHAKTILAAGAGSGKVAKYAARLCATPEPKRFDGVVYAYVYSALGGRADADGFSLVVPPGVLADSVGQWLTVAPQTTPSPDLVGGPAWPSASFKVLGSPWADGSKHVYVTLPTDPELSEFGDTAHAAVAHYDGDTRTSGEIADTHVNGDGTITAQVSHLSLMDSISEGVSWVLEPLAGAILDARFPAPTCDGTWQQILSDGSFERGTARVTLNGALLNLPGNTTPPIGFPQKHCLQSASSGEYDAHLKLVNNTRTFESLTRYGGDVTLTGPDYITEPFAAILALVGRGLTGHPVAYPGAEVGIEVHSGTAGTARMTPNLALTALNSVLYETPFKDVFDEFGNTSEATNAIFKDSLGCMMSAIAARQSLDDSSTSQIQGLEGILKDCIDFGSIRVAILDAKNAGLISPEKVGQVGVLLNKLQRYVLWLKVGRVAISGYDTWLGYAGGSAAGLIELDNYAPKPTVDAQGRRVLAKCLSPYLYTWRIDENCQTFEYGIATTPIAGSGGTAGLPPGLIARNSNGNAWFVDQNAKTVQPIADGGTYLCLAKHYAVDWDAPLASRYFDSSAGLTKLSEAATCDDSIADTRPINDGVVSSDAIVLREPDGTAWVVHDGVRQHIETGGEFECWVNPQSPSVIETNVWDQVTSAQLTHWPITTTNLAYNCGDPTKPTF